MVFAVTMFSIMVDLPKIPINFEYKNIKIHKEIGGYRLELFGGRIKRDLEIKKGLDIAGGVSVLLEADMSNVNSSDRPEALNSLKNIIERRVNLLGISEANVQTSQSADRYRVIVELAGVINATQALDTIGEVAQLDFRTESAKPQTVEIQNEDGTTSPYTIPNYDKTDLTGADLRKATVVFQNSNGIQTGEPEIQLQFNAEGTKKFREITQKSIDKRVAIYLDDKVVIAPTVQSAITDGLAVITGGFTIDQAKTLATQLNAGALPVPVTVLEQRTVGPTLGQESVDKSVYAGAVGLLIVMAFMILYYGRLGILASIALIIYGLITLALYKLIPVVLTLPGLAGFILSIGMAVDANILIFERIKEELRLNKPLSIALENGFGRSWDSIRDANIATLVTSFILFNPLDWAFLPTSGSIRGFALTLALGIFISLFTGIIVTRNLVRVFFHKKI